VCSRNAVREDLVVQINRCASLHSCTCIVRVIPTLEKFGFWCDVSYTGGMLL
jgi:hypothetical protein